MSGGFTGILNNDAGSAGNFQINNPVNNYSALYATTNGPGWAAAFEGGALVRGKGNTNATMGLRIENSFNQVKFAVLDGGNVSIGTPFALELGGYSAVGSLANKRGLSIASTNVYKADAPAVLELSGSTDGVGEEIGMIEFVTHGDLNSIYNTAHIAAVRESFNFTYTGLTFHTRIGATLAERMRINSSGNVGIGCNAPQYKLHVVGDIAAEGGTLRAQSAIINTTITACSDIRYKQNIHPLQSVLPALMQIQGVRYQFNVEAFPEKFFPGTDQIGFTSQEVEKFYPEIVVTDKEGNKSIDYTRFAPLLLQAIKEQQHVISTQKEEMTMMKEQCKAMQKDIQMLKDAVVNKRL